MSNLYYDPQELGYTAVGELEFSDSNYQYDTLMVITKDGEYFYAEDSGCSCPTPFEDVSESDLTPIALEKWDEFKAYVEGRVNDEYTYKGDGIESNAKDLLDLIYKGLGGVVTPSYMSEDEKWGE